MKKLLLIALPIVAIVIGIVAAIAIVPVRHAFTRALWKLFDRGAERVAAKAAMPTGVAIERDIPYSESRVPEMTLDAYHPEGAPGALPIVLFIHGGGFLGGDKRYAAQYCATLAKEGYLVLAANYRLAPRYGIDVQIGDVLKALDWAGKNGGARSGDPGKFFLAGDSAGAYLAAFAACLCADPALASGLGIDTPAPGTDIAGLLLFSGLYDLETAYVTGFPTVKSDIEMLLGVDRLGDFRAVGAWSVTGNLPSAFPPTFISSGAADKLHPESLALAKAMEERGVPHVQLFWGKGERRAVHDYQFDLDLDISRRCLQAALAFMRDAPR